MRVSLHSLRWMLVAMGLASFGAACLVREPVLFEPPTPSSKRQVSRRWHPNGIKSKEEEVLLWSNGRVERHGYSRAWYTSRQMTYERFYAADKPTKLWRSWFESGVLESEVMIGDGQTLEPMKFYYESGQLAAEGEGINGSRQGAWTYWHDNGQLSEQGKHDQTNKVGFWTYWNAEGQVLRKVDEGP
jgi:antitoxin component YwqK of YwqJK toxin-antitoxin module